MSELALLPPLDKLHDRSNRQRLRYRIRAVLTYRAALAVPGPVSLLRRGVTVAGLLL